MRSIGHLTNLLGGEVQREELAVHAEVGHEQDRLAVFGPVGLVHGIRQVQRGGLAAARRHQEDSSVVVDLERLARAGDEEHLRVVG